MTEHHARLRVRFYPHHGDWTVYVQRVDAEGVPVEDVLSAAGHSRDEARAKALAATSAPEVREALESSVHH
jgi:hypothetical protein